MDGRRPVTPGTHTTAATTAAATATPPTTRFRRRRPARFSRPPARPSMSGTRRATLSASPVRNLSSTDIVTASSFSTVGQPEHRARRRCCFTVEVEVPHHTAIPRPGGPPGRTDDRRRCSASSSAIALTRSTSGTWSAVGPIHGSATGTTFPAAPGGSPPNRNLGAPTPGGLDHPVRTARPPHIRFRNASWGASLRPATVMHDAAAPAEHRRVGARGTLPRTPTRPLPAPHLISSPSPV